MISCLLNEHKGGEKLKKTQKRLTLIALTFIFIFTLCGAVSAADIYVNDTGDDDNGDGSIENPYKTINWGVSKANDDDTINLNAAIFNTYQDNDHKDYDITIDKNLKIKGAGRDQTTIDASGNGRILTVLPGYTLIVSDLTMINGKAPDGTAGTSGGDGGAIINRGTLTLENCAITNCRAGDGGDGKNGVYLIRPGGNGGDGGNGGAIYNTGKLTINDCILSDNKAGNGGNGGNAYNQNAPYWGGNGGNGGYGGAIYNQELIFDHIGCEVTITRSIITDNYAGNGGNGGNGFFRGSGGSGGEAAIYVRGNNILNWAYLDMTRSILKDNHPGTGGSRGTGSSSGSSGSDGETGGIFADLYSDATVHYNYLFNNGDYDIRRHGTEKVDARCNWWGSNESPASRVKGPVNFTPWLILTISPLPTPNMFYTDTLEVIAEITHTNDNSPLIPGGPVADGIPITFTADWGSLDPISSTTVDGECKTTFTADGTLPLPVDLVQIFAIADNENNVKTQVNIQKMPTTIEVENAQGFNGQNVNLKANLKDNNGDPIEGKTVIFKVDGNQVGTAQTDADGVATLSYTIAKTAGTYVIEALFEEDDGYLGSSDTSTLTVDKTPTNLLVSNIIGNHGKIINLKATLTDYYGNPVAGKTIVFKVNGANAGSAITGANGVATLKYYVGLVGGKYAINAKFVEDNIYLGSTGKGELKVPQSNVYVITTISKKKIILGETVKITFKLGNKGPDTAENVIFTLVLPKGLTFVSMSGNPKYSYNPLTRTITWTLGNVPVGDPWLYVIVKATQTGSFKIAPRVSTITYDPNLKNSVQAVNINIVKPKAANGTVPMQSTGIPIHYLAMAMLLVVSGFLGSKRK
ncbi:Ig-like domain repeat protein [Methanobacterium alcaliphilum]|uniref:Ig-like domain repeat protein n=1 Tax=Methanobacterium alcaliphilum TaxID=392018 RepID=UPI00200B411F|nr:Ig-like domain repeat protein [Methanobacterium alcaliphilum]MCK9150408.1 Ig-like domain repeat protein [Methanobacterium alcaliphilum]